MRRTNLQLDRMLESLKKHLGRRDLIGYAAARNTRVIADELTEYYAACEGVVREYGAPVTDDDGKPTGGMMIPADSPDFKKAAGEIERFSAIEHDVSVMKLKYSDVMGELTGEEILSIDWMLED